MLTRKKAKNMIKQLMSEDIKDYLKSNSKIILLDVRTEGEWDGYGKPDGEKLGLKTYFLTIKDENFVNEFKDLLISKDYEILTMCKVGQRSQFVAQLLEKNDYICTNISDGFDGWKSSDLPCL
jgi:rhodanese-related sulfurtransferase